MPGRQCRRPRSSAWTPSSICKVNAPLAFELSQDLSAKGINRAAKGKKEAMFSFQACAHPSSHPALRFFSDGACPKTPGIRRAGTCKRRGEKGKGFASV